MCIYVLGGRVEEGSPEIHHGFDRKVLRVTVITSVSQAKIGESSIPIRTSCVPAIWKKTQSVDWMPFLHFNFSN